MWYIVKYHIKIYAIYIHLTDACNLKCKYCYENKSVREISFDNITKIIDNEIKQKSKYTTIYFYGGEPLLKKQTIKDTIKYIESKKCKTKFEYGIDKSYKRKWIYCCI